MRHPLVAVVFLISLPLPIGQGVEGDLSSQNEAWLLDAYARAGLPIDDLGRKALDHAAYQLALRGFSLPARQFIAPPTVAGLGDIVALCIGEWGPADCFITPLVPSVSTDPVFEELEVRTPPCQLPETTGIWLYRPNSYLVEAYNVELVVHMSGSELEIPGQQGYSDFHWDGLIAGSGCYQLNQPGVIQIYWSNGAALES